MNKAGLNCIRQFGVRNIGRTKLAIHLSKSQKPLVLHVRHYSPVRSRVPDPPPYQGRKKVQLDQNHPGPGYQQQYEQQYQPVYESPSGGVVQMSDGIASILSNPAIVVERQLEVMNVILGFEQANRYAILDTNGSHIGYMEEEDFGITKMFLRQVYRLHRPFSVRVMDRQGYHVMTVRGFLMVLDAH